MHEPSPMYLVIAQFGNITIPTEPFFVHWVHNSQVGKPSPMHLGFTQFGIITIPANLLSFIT